LFVSFDAQQYRSLLCSNHRVLHGRHLRGHIGTGFRQA
jgi:hypothetical protein